MSSILCLWKYRIYIREKKEGLGYPPEYNSKQSRLHSATLLGENAYIVTYLKKRCYLVAKITIAKQDTNEPSYEFGKFKIIGNHNPLESQYFHNLIDVTEILRQLRFRTNKPIGNSPRPLSLHLQTIRELTEGDVVLFETAISKAKP